MTLENIIALLLEPKQVFLQEKPKGVWLVSIAAAALASAALALSGYIAYQSELSGLAQWLSGSLLFFMLFAAAAFFYLPVVHLLAERFMVQSRASDLVAYSGLSLSPLLAALPLAFFSRFFKLGSVFFTLAVLIILIKILVNVVSGVSDNYKISRGRALWFTLLPGLLVLLLPLAAGIIAAVLIING
jgi:hypothetical protein